MSLRRGIFWCASGLPAVALGLLPLAPASAQRDDEPETEILSHEEGTIIVGRDSAPLPWARSASGPLVALGSVVEVLGGDLERGPLGEAHTVRVAGREVVLGPLSRTVVVDGEVHNLSIRPWIEPEPEYPDEEEEEDGETPDSEGDGEGEGPEPEEAEPELPPEPIEPRKLFVPVDALARAYPETLGYRFDFDRRRGLLRVDRTGERRLDVEVDRVHDLGATTLVVTFSNRPRFQVDRYRAGVRLRLLSGVMEPRRRVRLNDPLVRWIEVRERSVDVGLAPLAEASEPYLLGRPPRVQLVFDITRSRPGLRPRATPRAEEERREFRIVLDPGHGGTDNGVRAPSGESEKNLALRIAEALRSYLEFELGARVVLTRGGDSTVTLENRTSLANQYEADVFVSVHVGAAGAPRPGSAFQTWVLDPPPAPLEEEGTESEEAAGPDVAEDEPEPEPDAFEDEDLADLEAEPAEEEPPVVIPPLEPWDRVHDAELERSALLARLIQTQVGDVLDLPNRGYQRAPLRVLTGASMPAVLIEFGYEEVREEKTPVFDGPRGREVFEAIGRAIRLYRAVVTGAAETNVAGARS
ncbi:MAG: N-acetylmuramoyl-L-alanine amidase [Holophagales bacterium]|nr:N-acetylmuramoyl-L-alanine amidase [Holophagales bacterium]